MTRHSKAPSCDTLVLFPQSAPIRPFCDRGKQTSMVRVNVRQTLTAAQASQASWLLLPWLPPERRARHDQTQALSVATAHLPNDLLVRTASLNPRRRYQRL